MGDRNKVGTIDMEGVVCIGFSGIDLRSLRTFYGKEGSLQYVKKAVLKSNDAWWSQDKTFRVSKTSACPTPSPP